MKTLVHPAVARLGFRRAALIVAAGALAVTASLTVKSYSDLQARAADRLVIIGTSYRTLPDLPSLTGESQIVVVGKVISQGQTRLEKQPRLRRAPFIPPTPPEKPRGGQAQPDADRPGAGGDKQNQTLGGDVGEPTTDYTVQVTRVLKGNVRPDTKLVVSQPGGPLELPTYPGGPKLKRTFQFEDDPMMKVGEEHVFFLKRSREGTYFVSGGPQGRFEVSQGKVKPVAERSPLGKAHADESLDSFAEKVQQAKS